MPKDGLYPKIVLSLNDKKDVGLLGEMNEMRLRFPVRLIILGPRSLVSNANSSIIASESDYVRDLVVPAQNFIHFQLH